MVLGFTAAELASMYRKAIERGVPMKNHHHHHYQPSNQVLAEYSFDKPKVVPALRVQQPTGYGSDYAYYFYPLHSFRHELEKQTSFHSAALPDGYHTLVRGFVIFFYIYFLTNYFHRLFIFEMYIQKTANTSLYSQFQSVGISNSI